MKQETQLKVSEIEVSYSQLSDHIILSPFEGLYYSFADEGLL